MKKELVESQTTDNPSCSTSSMGYNPSYVFSWVLKRNGGTTIESLPPSRHEDTLDADAECGQTTGSSSLDAQKYVGWNESVLCCQLTDPADTSDVYAEACSEEIKLVPGKCLTCFTYIQCVTGQNAIYINKCPKSVGLCIDVDTFSCSLPPTTTTDPDATTTTPSPSARFTCTSVTDYRPYSDTYPDKCNKFQWCVNGKSHNQTCPGAGHEFTWEKDGDPTCAEPSDSTYCGKLRLLETTPSPGTGSTEAQSTTTVVTTTIGPFECGGNNPEYIPRADTYPDNCGHYYWCYGLGQHADYPCPGDSQFAYGSSACVSPGSGNSYCEQRAAAESGSSTTTDTPSV
ncbi:hypothetical protein BaRGS_00039852 [Batillaria attramentaria]|uniref:Chitin-binding type-2 domain-containing protein n=1 Tax=Batillaria attramentaria TaxID=370345 RepID=A0ABD0J1R6_9CAEN